MTATASAWPSRSPRARRLCASSAARNSSRRSCSRGRRRIGGRILMRRVGASRHQEAPSGRAIASSSGRSSPGCRRLPRVATLERTPHGHLEAVVLAAGELEATFVPAAGMIGCSLRHRGEELLVQRGGLGAWRGTGRSFGLPLLHPWANRLPDWRYAASGRAVTIDRERGIVRADEHGLPIHGALAAAEDWDVIAAEAGATARLEATLDYARRDDRLAVFPFPHSLTLELELDEDALTISTTLTATGEDD